MNAGQFYGIIADGEPKELLAEQLKPFKAKVLDLELNNTFISNSDILDNYTKIVNESKYLFTTDVNIVSKSKTKKKYLDLEL